MLSEPANGYTSYILQRRSHFHRNVTSAEFYGFQSSHRNLSDSNNISKILKNFLLIQYRFLIILQKLGIPLEGIFFFVLGFEAVHKLNICPTLVPAKELLDTIVKQSDFYPGGSPSMKHLYACEEGLVEREKCPLPGRSIFSVEDVQKVLDGTVINDAISRFTRYISFTLKVSSELNDVF